MIRRSAPGGGDNRTGKENRVGEENRAKFWSLSDEFYRFTHQWPLVLLTIVTGCLVGWASQYVWPSYHRATVEVFVALDPYRAFSDTTFLALARPKYSNVDDFKNWQMSQLESVIFTEPFIEETLKNLRQQDSYWMGIEADELRDMLDADWRSAGTWSLVANHPDPERASEVVQDWSDVSIARVQAAILAAQKTFQLDQELDAVTQLRIHAGARRSLLQDTSASLLAWQEFSVGLPANQPLEPTERWRVLALITPVADFTPAWMALLDAQPDPSGLPADYMLWIDQVTAHINAEKSALAGQVRRLEQQQTDLAIRYTLTSKDSLGLSPNLEIQSIQFVAPRAIRPTGTLIILGGIIGFLLWIFIQLAQIGRAAAQLQRKDQ